MDIHCLLVGCNTDPIKVVDDPDFAIIVLHMILNKVSFHTHIHVLSNFLTVFQIERVRLLETQSQFTLTFFISEFLT